MKYTLDVNRGYVISHQYDFIGMDFFAVLPSQCLAAYQSTLKQTGNERACTRERVKDMNILI